jgi:hypothetical protein
MSDLLNIVGPSVYSAIYPYVSTADLYKSPVFSVTAEGFFEEDTVRQGIRVLFEIDLTAREKFRILEWLDAVDEPLNR